MASRLNLRHQVPQFKLSQAAITGDGSLSSRQQEASVKLKAAFPGKCHTRCSSAAGMRTRVSGSPGRAWSRTPESPIQGDFPADPALGLSAAKRPPVSQRRRALSVLPVLSLRLRSILLVQGSICLRLSSDFPPDRCPLT